VACNQGGNQVTVFRADRATGRLGVTGQVGSPPMIAFLA
jgi:6-phosphogluconolactonase (cycloisomerase 2 family)